MPCLFSRRIILEHLVCDFLGDAALDVSGRKFGGRPWSAGSPETGLFCVRVRHGGCGTDAEALGRQGGQICADVWLENPAAQPESERKQRRGSVVRIKGGSPGMLLTNVWQSPRASGCPVLILKIALEIFAGIRFHLK